MDTVDAAHTRETKVKRAINSAPVIRETNDLNLNDGQFVIFEGRVKCDSPFPSTYVLDSEGKPKNNAIYHMEEHKWLLVEEEVQLPTNNLGKYFTRKQWVKKDQLLKKSEIEREFYVFSKKKGKIIPAKVKKSTPDFPLLSTYDVYSPPKILAAEGELLAKIYEIGSKTTEKYLALDTKITVIGVLRNDGGVHRIGPEEHKPYIITSLSEREVKNKLRAKGVPEFTLAIVSFGLGLSLIAFNSVNKERRY